MDHEKISEANQNKVSTLTINKYNYSRALAFKSQRSYMNEKQLTDLLILHLAKKMIEKMEKIKNGFHHHDVKL